MDSHFPEGLRELMYVHRVTRRSRAAYCPNWSAVWFSPAKRPVWAQEKLFSSVARAAVVQRPAVLLTALEWVTGEIGGNVWQGDQIARIDTATGSVTGWIDLAGILPQMDCTGKED